ncbi:MAG: RNA-processing protein [Methanobrevibacter arboriphilus]|uniref:RNA-processing protein n=2 Tax=Methanobrevibacter arboriphilus TaxID=39441 RepID=A0ACA8R4D2_METAZ|nr:KH domain-containing protein [Methanobrevibacter arboriphilus]MBF4468566.1 RNA-processing protein [Methanobrevibacter arboriphilus]MCC7561431.1 KH domain-containing protein [Methanobrevibacter arboriphilus]BBL62576.1 RNA-processing protein [Methanobrevibacter arboriphilus]GLI12655.1 RNA-processing protein [Methanobrevibacter arboriphilus]
MPTTEYLKIPQDRIGVLIGTNGETKQKIEKTTHTWLDIDGEEGTVIVSPSEEMEDPLGVWKTNHVVKAIGRGFNPEIALKLNEDDIYLEIIKLTLYVGKSKKALARQKGRIIGKDGRTREIIISMAEVDMAIYGKTVAFIGELENVMVAKEAVEMILNGSQHKSVYGFLESKQSDRKMKEFKSMVGIEDDKIEFRDDLDD